MSAPAIERLDKHAAYSVADAAAHLGCSAQVVRDLAQAGEFGDKGAWTLPSPTGARKRIRIAGWAIDAYKSRHSAAL